MANDKKRDVRRNEYTAMSLYQLLGAPLHALVDAETHAASATAKFIAAVGFDPDAGPGPGEAKAGPPGGAPPAPAAPAAPAGQEAAPPEHAAFDDDWRALGKLRMASFRHVAPDGAVHRIEVPVLSLVPIPALQIKEASIEFAVKVVDTLPIAAQARDRRRGLTDPPQLVDLKGSIARQGGEGDGVRQSETQMKVKVTVQQADVPSGLSRLFHLMDQQVASERHPRVEVSPATIVLDPEKPAAVTVTVTVRDERAEPQGGVRVVPDAGPSPAPLAFASASGAAEAITDDDGKAVFTVSRTAAGRPGRVAVIVRATPPRDRAAPASRVREHTAPLTVEIRGG